MATSQSAHVVRQDRQKDRLARAMCSSYSRQAVNSLCETIKFAFHEAVSLCLAIFIFLPIISFSLHRQCVTSIWIASISGGKWSGLKIHISLFLK